MKNTLRIMGCRGVPASHGGFETFAEHFSLYLVEKGWSVEVYCQVDGKGSPYRDEWCGVQRVNIPVAGDSAFATAIFDLKGIVHSLKSRDPVLTLGYNTAIFNVLHRLCRVPNIINMDGIEWKRGKWSFPLKAWFFVNEILGCWLGNKLVADHPAIKDHLNRIVRREKIYTIPYGSEVVDHADLDVLRKFGLQKEKYAILIARPEPENNILEVVEAFSRNKRDFKLVVLGHYSADKLYQSLVMQAASSEVIFPGAIYDQHIVRALRFFARFYIHGHTVGGTNPSLIEAMGVGAAILAHDNIFNRWVTADNATYFSSINDCDELITKMIKNDEMIKDIKNSMQSRHAEVFKLNLIHVKYEELILGLIKKNPERS